jgi:uncharacterized glyoxalase superfamily protein PhnB
MGVGLKLDFPYQNFYAGIRAGHQHSHINLVDEKDPSIDFVDRGEHFHLYLETDYAHATAEAFRKKGIHLPKEVHETLWRTREFSVKDDQGHILYFGERRQVVNNACSRPPMATAEHER